MYEYEFLVHGKIFISILLSLIVVILDFWKLR